MQNNSENIRRFQRHDLVWLSAMAWSEIRARQPENLSALLRTWQVSEWPLEVRRRDVDADEDRVCISITPPPSSQPLSKIASCVRQVHILEHQSALALSSVVETAPECWREQLRNLIRDALQQQIKFRVYGSLAWQYLTGQPYMSEQTAIEILFIPRTTEQLIAGMRLLTHHAKTMPLAGEMTFPSGHAVAWKEWTYFPSETTPSDDIRVLVKHVEQVRVMSQRALLASLNDMTD